jgi:methylated-DNA-[protein]-cysteine S-methyltransferase
MTTCSTVYSLQPSPIGELLLVGDGTALTELYLPAPGNTATLCANATRQDSAFTEVVRQLQAYFAGELTRFDVPIAPHGTAFQHDVWSALGQIPYGTTSSYGRLAAQLNHPAAARAVGHANGHNPISIIIPCHRLIGANGSLVKYGGGLERKRWLLDLEARVAARRAASESSIR